MSVPLAPLRTASKPTVSFHPGAGEEDVGCSGAQQMGLDAAGPEPLTTFPPFSGLRSYPLRGSHSLDDLLDRPGNSTASSDYWDGQSRSRTPSRVPSRTPSPAPTPSSSSRRSSVGSMGVASDAKVGPSRSLRSTRQWASGQGDQATLPATPWLAGGGPPSPASACPSVQGRTEGAS